MKGFGGDCLNRFEVYRTGTSDAYKYPYADQNLHLEWVFPSHLQVN